MTGMNMLNTIQQTRCRSCFKEIIFLEKPRPILEKTLDGENIPKYDLALATSV